MKTTMKTKLRIYSLGIALFAILEARAQSPSLPASNSIPVTVDNFIRAESDLYISVFDLDAGPVTITLPDAGLIAEPGISAYIAAKHGVIGLSKAAAVEHASTGIRINALAPGLVNTVMTKAWFDDPNMKAHFIANTPIGRVSQPEEIAGVVLFLCSDLASFAVGQTFVIDGGYTTH